MTTTILKRSLALVALSLACACVQAIEPRFLPEDEMRQLVAGTAQRIREADYAADLQALAREADALEQVARQPQAPPRTRYWQGYAHWRWAMNAANPPQRDRDAIRAHLQQAVRAFRPQADSGDLEARIGLFGALGTLAFFTAGDDPRQREIGREMGALAKELAVRAADNPRYLWLKGSTDFYVPPPIGHGPDAAMAAYYRGIALAMAEAAASDPLEPAWGLPELYMSAAFAASRRPDPQPALAKRLAQTALRLQPGWRYVDVILLPDIEASLPPEGE